MGPSGGCLIPIERPCQDHLHKTTNQPKDRGRKKHINFFNINFLPPTRNPPFWAPRKKFMCLISWERAQKRDPHKLFRGDFWGQKERKISPKRKFLGRTSRGHPGVIRADIPAKNFGQGGQNPGKTSTSARTSMTRKRGRPRP